MIIQFVSSWSFKRFAFSLARTGLASVLTDSVRVQQARAAHAAQIDDLLSIINTDGRFLVNGELSISEDEYRAWLARAGGC